MGAVLLIIGVAGSITCVVALCIMQKNWKKNRQQLLKEIEREEWIN